MGECLQEIQTQIRQEVSLFENSTQEGKREIIVGRYKTHQMTNEQKCSNAVDIDF